MTALDDIPVTDLSDQTRRRAADLIRADVGEAATELADEIVAGVPEFARPLDERYVRTIRVGVEQALLRFADLIEHRGERDESWRAVYRAIGAGEVREGRSLEALHAAIRIGARVGWQRLVATAKRESLPLSAFAPLAEAIFTYLDDLAEASADGYAQAQAAEAGELARRRRRLLELLVADPPASAEAVTAAAVAARWRLPSRLVAVAVEPAVDPGQGIPVLSPEMLPGLHRVEPCLILPDPKSPAQVRALTHALTRYRAAIGPAVTPTDAAKSLRWARLALELSSRGILHPDGLLWCTDHLATLAVFQDEDLLTVLAERRLAPLASLRDGQREPLTDTLLAWLQLNMNANEVAARLHVHPQTVRHRLRQLHRLLGDQIRDLDLRFELEVALRAERAMRGSRAAETPR